MLQFPELIAAPVALLVHYGAHAAVVVAASHHGQVAQVKLDEVLDLACSRVTKQFVQRTGCLTKG
jgi:hypothetical protein